MATVLVTGGAGFIGTHTLVALAHAGHDAVVLDNLCNSHEEALVRVGGITGRPLTFVRGDVRDPEALDRAFSSAAIEAVIHFAGLKAVAESVAKPLEYYDTNVVGTLRVLEAMKRHGANTLVFSSSATVYGFPDVLPVTEDARLQPINAYGRSKLMCEQILADASAANPRLRIGILRYFNPIGAYESGAIGEDPEGIPNNLVPFVMQVAVGRRDKVRVFGSDYATHDGTGVRDYIHVMDLAEGHVAALRAAKTQPSPLVVNLGTGTGYSVRQVIDACSRAVGRDLPFELAPRREGDAEAVYADCSRAQTLLGWTAKRGLTQMCEDAWRWQRQNPQGYRPLTDQKKLNES
jgi:UDP-glucose 4-epimerase